MTVYYGSDDPDHFIGDDAANTAFGNGGDDTLLGGGGDDLLYGGYSDVAGNLPFDGNDILDGGAGNDVLFGGGADDTLYGGDGDDVLHDGFDNYVYDSGNDTLDGGAGNDLIYGGAGADRLDGGDGADAVAYVDSGAAIYVDLTSGLGRGGDAEGDVLSNIETIWGSSYDDTLLGSGGDNMLDGSFGNDAIAGGDGNDYLAGGAGADHLDGGAGVDTVAYSGDGAVSVDLASGMGYGGEAEGDVIANVENVQGTIDFGDELYGSAADNILSGYGGDDSLFGRDGNDTLLGGAGNDFLQGGAGADHLDGGDGVDTIDYNGDAGVFVDLASGLGHGGEAEGDIIANVENIQGTGGFGDGLYGSAADNILSGYGGDDTLSGRDGNDTLDGGAGVDTLTGGAGADVFLYQWTGDSTVAAADRITDFSQAEGDRIDLSRIDADTDPGAPGDQGFRFIGTSDFTHQAGELHYAFSGADTVIAGDVDGDGAADFSILLTGHVSLGAGDFVL